MARKPGQDHTARTPGLVMRCAAGLVAAVIAGSAAHFFLADPVATSVAAAFFGLGAAVSIGQGGGAGFGDGGGAG